MKIRYVGGPLNRQTFDGPRLQPHHRDRNGLPIRHRAGTDRILAARQLGAVADIYCYDHRTTAYVHLSQYIAECPYLAEELTA